MKMQRRLGEWDNRICMVIDGMGWGDNDRRKKEKARMNKEHAPGRRKGKREKEKKFYVLRMVYVWVVCGVYGVCQAGKGRGNRSHV